MIPRLVHPVEVQIAHVDPATPIDPVFREPTGGTKYLAPVTIKAQVRYERHEEQNMIPGGDSPVTRGWLTMLARDVEAWGIKPRDKIVKVADVSVEYYITEIRPCGYYSGTAYLMRLVFESRPRG